MDCHPTAWTHPTKIGKDDPCPRCGQDGYGHLTAFVEDAIGRHCLTCHSTWPIDAEPAPSDTTEPTFGPALFVKELLGWRRRRLAL